MNADHHQGMEKMWLVLTEIIGDTEHSSPRRNVGFMNVVTWADSKEVAAEKIRRYLESFGWHLVAIDQAEIVDEDTQYGEQVCEMIERIRVHPRESAAKNLNL